MKYSFKPLKNMHLYCMWIFYIFPVSFFDIGCIIVSLNKFDVKFFITCIIITLLPFIVYIIVRIFYPYKYIINDKYLIKFKKKKIIFKIKTQDIKCIVIKKAKFMNYFKFIASMILYYNLSTANITTMSLIFEKCEIFDDNKDREVKREGVIDNNKSNYKEYVEVLPYKEIKKIYKILNVNYKIKYCF